MTTLKSFKIGQTVSSKFHGVTGKVTDFIENGSFDYPEITVEYKIIAFGSADDYRDTKKTFVMPTSSDWIIELNK
jgi:hypothetical protein